MFLKILFVEYLFLTISFLFFGARVALAVTISTSNIPSQINDQPFTLSVSVSGASAGINYLRIDLFKDGSTNYFGETNNGASWYNGSDGKQYFPITIVSGQTWNGSVSGRIGNPTSTEFPGSGNYKLKIRRYTSSGNLASSDQQTPVDITINFTLPSPTPSPSPSPSGSSSTSSSFSISNVPSDINSSQSFTTSVNLSLPSSPNTKFYLKGAFKKSDSSNYFGLTKVNSSWVKNSSSYSDQYAVTTDSSGNWDGKLEVQIDAFDSGYEGSGDYIFKVGRYTESGSNLTWSNEQNIKINAKEVTINDEEIGVIDLSKTSPSPKTEVLGQSEEIPELPEEVYSLEKYVKVSTYSATPTAREALSKVKSKSQINFLTIIGAIFALASLGSLVYIYIQFRLKS